MCGATLNMISVAAAVNRVKKIRHNLEHYRIITYLMNVMSDTCY